MWVFKMIRSCQDVSAKPVRNPFNKEAYLPVAVKLDDADLQCLLY